LSDSYIQLPPDGTGKKVRGVSASAVAANKHHITLWNGSTYRLRVLRILVSMHTTGTVTGYVMQFLVYRALSVSGGTQLTIDKLDPDDPNPPRGIEAYTGASVTTTGSPLVIFAVNPEDTGGQCFIDFSPPKPIVVKPSSGLTIQQYGIAGVGLFNAVIYFSVEVIKP
jgi:hypothetical protein